MARKLIQDIFVKGKTADAIRAESDNDLIKRNSEKQAQEKDSFEKKDSFDKLFSKKKKIPEEIGGYGGPEEKISKNSHVFIWAICIIAVATLLFFVSSFFSTATISITPKSEPVALNDLYMITTSTSTTQGLVLHYKIITLTNTMPEALQTNGEEGVSKKATGKARIYNNYSTASERLANNTRLETKDGLIYRIIQPVNVPGERTINGVKTPGSVEVNIVADLPGADYNMKLSDFKGDFTIPGFKGMPEYKGFYARLSTDMTGGYVGNAKTVSASVLSAGRTQLKNDLQTELIKDVYSESGNQDKIFPNDYFMQYTDLPDVSDAANYTISESATIYAIAFNKTELADFIAKNKLGDYDNSNVDAIWNDDVSVKVSGMTAAPWLENQLKATFSGDVKIVWSYDSEKIIGEAAGQNKSILEDIMNENKSSIINMSASIIPAWVNNFPKNTDKIKIIDSVRDAAQ